MEGGEASDVTFVTLYARIVYELALNPRVGQNVLAHRLNVTIRTVQRHINNLEDAGFISVQRDRKPFTYEIAWDRSIPYFSELTLGIFQPPPEREVLVIG